MTEIWCEQTSHPADLSAIIEHNLETSLRGRGVGRLMLAFVSWLRTSDLGQRTTVSIRDYLAWTTFINKTTPPPTQLPLREAVLHGANLTFLDALGAGPTASHT